MRAADNPFRSECVAALRCRPVGTTWAELLGRLGALHHRAVVAGPRGSGKTVLLAALGARLEAGGTSCLRLRLDTARPRLDRGAWRALAALPPGGVVLLDGAEQLGAVAWRAFAWRCRRAAGLVVTAHRPGRLPLLHTCTTSVELLEELVCELLPPAWSRPPGPVLEAAFARSGGNLRDALGALYDACACAASPDDLDWTPPG